MIQKQKTQITNQIKRWIKLKKKAIIMFMEIYQKNQRKISNKYSLNKIDKKVEKSVHLQEGLFH